MTTMQSVRLITEAYDIVTEESAREGDVADRGWIDEEGTPMELDEYDQEEGLTVAEKAANYLRDKGVTECSSWPWSIDSWYNTEQDTDWITGEHETRYFFLKGFTPDEQKEIYCLLFPTQVKFLKE